MRHFAVQPLTLTFHFRTIVISINHQGNNKQDLIPNVHATWASLSAMGLHRE
jgi:hypothetical protein